MADHIAELVEEFKTNNAQTAELIAQLKESKQQEKDDLPSFDQLMEQFAPEVKKMLEEQQLAELVQSNPAVRDAKTALDVLVALNRTS